MIKYLSVLVFLGAMVCLEFLGSYKITDALFIVIGFVAFVVNRHHPNIVGLLIIIVGVRGLEAIIWMIYTGKSAYVIYPLQFCMDLLAIYLIHKRWLIYLRLNKSASVKDIVFTNADFFLIQVYICYAGLVFFAFVEHLVRHPYAIGLPAEWALPDALFIYNHLDIVRFILSYWQYALILLMADRYFRSPRFIHA